MIVKGCGNRCIAVDPGFSDEDEKREFLKGLEGLVVEAVLLTHSHLDHILGVKFLQDMYKCPVYASAEDAPLLEYNHKLAIITGLPIPDDSYTVTAVRDGDEISVAGLAFKVIATPGHTPGSVCWYCESEKLLLTGDTLFKGTIGRTDLRGGDYDKLIVSIMDKIMALPGSTEIFPGHGGTSTLSEERTLNPMLEPFNEPGQDYNV